MASSSHFLLHFASSLRIDPECRGVGPPSALVLTMTLSLCNVTVCPTGFSFSVLFVKEVECNLCSPLKNSHVEI